MSEDIKAAQEAVRMAIAELKAKGVHIPISLHRAAHALAYATRPKPA